VTVPYLKLFPDLSVTVDMLSDAEAGRLLKSLLHYGNGQVDEMPGNERFIFSMLKVQIDRDAATYQDMIDRQRMNGKKGGAPKGNKNAAKQPGGCFENDPNNPNNPNNPDKDKEEDKDEDKEKDNDDDLQRAEASPAQVATLTLVDGTSYGITEADREKDAAAYPGVNVMQEYLKMQRWLEANPKNRKTRSGIRRFVNSWLDRAQNSARREPASQRPAKQNPSLNYEQRSYAEEVNKHEMPEWLRQEVAT